LVAVKAVVFDLGGVLIDWDPRYLYRKLLADEAAVEEFLATICTPEWNTEQDRGRPFAEAVAELSERHPAHAANIAAFHERWPEMLGGDVPGTVELLAELRATGVPLYALTNWSAETFALALERFEFLDWFDGLLVSGEERIVKPDPAIFQLLLDRFGLDAGATLFVDDSEANVAAADALGFDAVRFRDPDRLRRDLAERGLLDGGPPHSSLIRPTTMGASMPDPTLDDQVRSFFDTFARASDTLDVDDLGELFGETFLAADPGGAQPVPRELFLQALPRRAELFRAAGITRVVLTDLRHEALDDSYVLARTGWRAERGPAAAGAPGPVRLSSTFLLRRDGDRLRVVLYLNHQDLGKVLSLA
jgi:2-haloacid dehalogenase